MKTITPVGAAAPAEASTPRLSGDVAGVDAALAAAPIFLISESDDGLKLPLRAARASGADEGATAGQTLAPAVPAPQTGHSLAPEPQPQLTPDAERHEHRSAATMAPVDEDDDLLS